MDRKADKQSIEALCRQFPPVAILGARQTGKTTLARSLPYDHLFDLENPRDLAHLANAQLALER